MVRVESETHSVQQPPSSSSSAAVGVGVPGPWSSDGLKQTVSCRSTGPRVAMSGGSKSVNSAAVKAEVRRYESLQKAIGRLSKQLERVEDEQLRSGLKVYLHSVQGKLAITRTDAILLQGDALR